MLSTDAYNPLGMRARRLRIIVALVGAAPMLVLAACGSGAKSSASGGSKSFIAFLRFAECMRSHGVTNFPDPNPSGGLRIGTGDGLNPHAPAFRQAQGDCRKLLPGGGPPREVPESVKVALLNHAECIRAHGVPDYPDPTFPSGGGIESLAGPNVDPSSAAFQRAAKECRGP